MKETVLKKITTVGNGLGVVLPKNVLSVMKLEKGEMIRLTVEKIKEVK